VQTIASGVITMSDVRIGRRTFLQGAGLAALGAAGIVPLPAEAQYSAPNSTGTERATLKAPPNSCDCHLHIHDARFTATRPGADPHARVADYRLLQRRIGTTRCIVITPGPYATDNSVTLDAISQMTPNARGVAVVQPTITDAELKALAKGGIRGVRFSVNPPEAGATGSIFDTLVPLSKRVNALGLHMDINTLGDQVVEYQDMWSHIAAPIVFDHMAHISEPMGVNHPSFGIVCKLVEQGRAWVKLSVTFRNTKVGPPTYADSVKVAAAYVKAIPERLVWGSNWPHPTENPMPDDALIFDLIGEFAPSASTRHRILVENAETLYGFPKSS
jgi:predicted TIM-barrel fold metal-dependent hydrolase